ncbi:hypothetical protein [Nonomuraea sp. GTA35]|uniref:hypothetical protein n=1 Tax=Nonomuraea sp. GTA35 TaxID=1676746 RepID=UPI0035BF6B5E
MDRRELAAFLRSRRERITPADVGLPAGPRRPPRRPVPRARSARASSTCCDGCRRPPRS